MRKSFLIIAFLISSTFIYAQDLKNPKLEISGGGSSWSSGNYLLFIDPGTYIKKSDIDVRDLKDLLREWEDKKRKITEQERLLDENKKTISEQQKQLNEQKRELDEMKRSINQLTRQVEDLQKKAK